MLHKAARNAYSWWWASHIRTKQSKWLDQNLQDMEEKVVYILKIIQEDGDTFAQRAEMYYRKRPELVYFVEDSFRSYRALAERYDHLSRELQSANRTMAAIYPERIPLEMHEEFDDDGDSFVAKGMPFNHGSSKNLPVAPELSIQRPSFRKRNPKGPSRLMSKKGLIKINEGDDRAFAQSSGLSKPEALKEIDKLQKEILALQTEKEFIKSSYENGVAKYWDIENHINQLQAKVNNLQDEFGIGTVIEDDEARTLMITTALKSCQQTLAQLEEKQHQSTELVTEEYLKFEETRKKLDTLKEKLISKEVLSEEDMALSPKAELKNLEGEEGSDKKSLSEKIKEQLKLNSGEPLTMHQLENKVDAFVENVINLESAISSQASHVKRLKSEINELQGHIQSIEEDNEILVEGSNNLSQKIRELEEEMHKVQCLIQSVEDQNNHLKTNFIEAGCSHDELSEKLHTVKPDEEVISEYHVPGIFTDMGMEGSKKGDLFMQNTKGDQKNFAKIGSRNHLPDFLSVVDQVRAASNPNLDKGFSNQEMATDPASRNPSANAVYGVRKTQSYSFRGEETDQVPYASYVKPHHGFKEDITAPGHDETTQKNMITEEPGKNNHILRQEEGANGDVLMKELGENGYADMKGNVANSSMMIQQKKQDKRMASLSDLVFTENLEARSKEHGVQSVIPENIHNCSPIGQVGDLMDFPAEMPNRSERSFRDNTNKKYRVSDDVLVVSRDSEWKEQKKDISADEGIKKETRKQDHNVEQNELGTQDDDEPNWKALFVNELDDREKILLQEYTRMLRNYKEVKKKLTEVEKKKRASLFQSAVQIKVLRNANSLKEEEIQSLMRRLNLLQSNYDETQRSSVCMTESNPQIVDHKEVSDNSKKAILDRTEASTGEEEEEKASHVEEKEEDMNIDYPDETQSFSTLEEKIRMDIDDMLEENIEFWLRFSTSFYQTQKFQTSLDDLQAEVAKLKEKKQGGKNEIPASDIRPIYRHFREIQTELTLWVDHNAVLKDDLQNRLSSLINLLEEIEKLSNSNLKIKETTGLSYYQAAKFQGEIMNMKQENNKVAAQLEAGLEFIMKLQDEIQRTLSQLDEELGISANKMPPKNRSRIPLRSFLFGVKLKKQKPSSIFACVSPALQRQNSDLTPTPT